MPEMVRFCGQRLTVHKVAHKLCDTISGTGMRRMDRAVHLTGARCDGSAHGGCQTACSMYWKEAWLRRVEPGASDVPAPEASVPGPVSEDRLLKLVEAAARKEPGADGEELFSCQATELLRAAPVCLPFRSLGQYAVDVRSGNAGVLATLSTLFVGLFNRYQKLSRRVLPRRLWIRRGMEWGFVPGGPHRKTPTGSLGLRPGELVRIRSKEEIVATLNADRLNRGLGFEEEMARHCGKVARVQARVERALDEKTGRLLTMKSPCISLEGIFCDGGHKQNCPGSSSRSGGRSGWNAWRNLYDRACRGHR
nr:hypothetical protein GCM10020093_083350 [Planobispora longispora]